MIIRTTLSKWVMCSDLSFLLKISFDKSEDRNFNFTVLAFYAILSSIIFDEYKSIHSFLVRMRSTAHRIS